MLNKTELKRMIHQFLDINECENEDCNGRGECIDGDNSFTCRCQPGFQGKRCESSKSILF